MIAGTVIAVSLVLFSVAVVTLWWMMHAWRTPQTLAATKFAEPDGAFALSFSLIVPARHEQNVLGHTVERLLQSTHTEYEIIIIVGHDDPETTRTAIQLVVIISTQIRDLEDWHAVRGKVNGGVLCPYLIPVQDIVAVATEEFVTPATSGDFVIAPQGVNLLGGVGGIKMTVRVQVPVILFRTN